MEKIVNDLHNKEKETTINSLEYFAQIFKIKRKKENMTLEEASTGICSISYLSKLENSLVVSIEDSFIKKLCERVDIDYNEVKDFKDNTTLETLAYYYFCGNYDKIDEMYYEMNDNLENAKCDIIRGFSYLINHKYAELKELLNTIYNISPSLQPIETFLFVILSNELDLVNYNINNILKIYEQFQRIPCRFETVQWLIELQGLKIYFHSCDYIKFNYFYEKIRSHDELLYPHEVTLLAKLMKILLEIKNNAIYIRSENFINSIETKSYYSQDILYLKLCILYLNKEYNEVVKYIQINELKDDRFEVVKRLSLYQMGKYHSNNGEEDFHNYHKIVISFLNAITYIKEKNIEINQALNMIRKYSKYEALYNHFIYNNFIFKNYITLLSFSTSYKETSLYLRENIFKNR